MIQSPDIWQNSDESISDFQVSGQALINVNCHNSRTSNDIDMKLVAVTTLEERNREILKKIYDEGMSASFDVLVVFPFYG